MWATSVFVCLLLAVVNSARILVVVPAASISHQVVFRPLIQGLIKRGHEVTFITTDPIYSRDERPNNLTEIDLHDLSYGLWNKFLSEFAPYNQDDHVMVLEYKFREISRIFGEQLKDKSVQKLVKDKTVKFDLLIVEAVFTAALVFSHIFKAPLIQMSSFGATPGNMETMGALTHPLLYPTHYQQHIYNHTIWEKFSEFYTYVALNKMLERQEEIDHKMLQNIFGNDVPPLGELKNNIDMLFLNVHPIWVHNQPVPQNVVFTWGIHKVPEKPLPKDLQSFLDSSTRGVIFVSFGSNVKASTISADKMNILLKVFSQLSYDILWKWDLNELPGKSDNIKIAKWVPQVDVLRHPNLKLFITQGGLQSTDEAINAGVPLIGFPMFADQTYNTAKYEHFKIGKQLDIKSFSEEDLKTAITNIFANYKSYKSNIITLRTQMQDLPMPPLENAIWWVEHVLRHGGAKHLRTTAFNKSLTEYYELEFVSIVVSCLIGLVAMVITIVRYSCKYISGKLNPKVKNKLS